MKVLNVFVIAATVLALLGLGAWGYAESGLYNIGADSPHTRPVAKFIESLRDNATKAHSRDIQPPNLDAADRIAEGAEHYSSMCTGCHLAPGMSDSEMRVGMYPQPPNLAEEGIDDPAEAFWIIKHGVKMSAMPAWGKTHTDEQIWNMVAFLQKLPGMTPAQYAQLGGKPPAEDEDHMHAGMDEHHADEENHEDPRVPVPAK